jgi:hypothetical protein
MNLMMLKEIKTVIANRVPPGDRWKLVDDSTIIYQSLTDALEAYYHKDGYTSFYIDARRGIVEIVVEEQVETPIKRFSLYGEE